MFAELSMSENLTKVCIYLSVISRLLIIVMVVFIQGVCGCGWLMFAPDNNNILLL